MALPNPACRCGWDGQGEHPCHYPRVGGVSYSCKRPAKRRFYEPTKLYSLPGMQMKMSVSETFACDECWATFQIELETHHKQELVEAKKRLGLPEET